MFSEKRRALAILLVLLDMAGVTLSLFLAWFFRQSMSFGDGLKALFPLSYYAWLLILVLPSWYISAHIFALYKLPIAGRRTGSEVFFKILTTTIIATGLTAMGIFGLHLHWVSRSWMAFFSLNTFILVLAAHGISHHYEKSRNTSAKSGRKTLLVGSGSHAVKMARTILENPEWGFTIIGYLSVSPGDFTRARPLRGYDYLGSVGDLAKVLESRVVDEVILAADRAKLKELEQCASVCEEYGVTTRILFNVFPRKIAKARVEDWGGLPLLSLETTPTNLVELGIKRIFDVTVSLLVLTVFSPLMFLFALLIKLTSKGPVFFKQVRVGLNRRQFSMYKFRSMYNGSDSKRESLSHMNAADGPAFKVERDPRITPVGRWMRRFDLDELPQFINVLKGEMSIVGPRPPLPDEVAKYEPWHMRRLSVRPGITCTWQVSPERNKIAFHEWIAMDLDYIDNWSLWLDLKLIGKTIPVVLVGRDL